MTPTSISAAADGRQDGDHVPLLQTPRRDLFIRHHLLVDRPAARPEHFYERGVLGSESESEGGERGWVMDGVGERGQAVGCVLGRGEEEDGEGHRLNASDCRGG